ncbi:metallopeptidase family protein [Nocardioides sp.]|uniref:metallopeptidase family protein n=1 Tax=Nocardioides sp. TaxID=35761 RepID=UPI003D0DC3FE
MSELRGLPDDQAGSPAGGADAVLRPRRRRTRDRRGRGLRGPAILPRRLGTPERPTARELFDDLVLATVEGIEDRWQQRLGLVEYAVEDAPQIPDDWQPDRVPLSSLIRAGGTDPARIVVFRRPIEHRCQTRPELEAMVHTVLVEQVAELLGVPVEEIDPRYGED